MTTNTFVGSYVQDIKGAMTAGILSGQNVILLSAPGWGKTAISKRVAQHVAGDAAISFIRVDPSTPPDVISGPYDPAAMLNGVLQRVTAGTPFDPQCRLAIIDEIGRGSDALFDKCLDVLDRQDGASVPVIATSNFMPSSDRQQAMLDRFAIWLWVVPGACDVAGIVGAQLASAGKPDVDPAGLPTWDDVQTVWAAKPGPQAVKVVSDLISAMSREAQVQGFTVHPRRLAQWSAVLFRAGMFYSGMDPDFSAMPSKATALLKYCWPAMTAEDQATWATFAASVVDVTGAAIELEMAKVMEALNRVVASGNTSSMAVVGELGQITQKAEQTLKTIAGDDPRVAEAIKQMKVWFGRALNGQPIE